MDEGDLRDLLREHASTFAVPGAALGVMHEGAVTTAWCGTADVTTGEPVTSETVYSVGSLTKSMVATVIARLAADGRLSLDDPVAAHVPELRTSGWAQTATVRDLLANRAGVPLRADLEFGLDARAGRDGGAVSRLVGDIDRVPAAGFWSYTNVGWCVLGRVIETVTAAPWDDAMQHHLGGDVLPSTTFGSDASKRRRAVGHEISRPDAGPVTGPVAVPVAPLSARAYGPAGTTAVAPVDDLLRFAAMHLEDASLASLRVPHADVSICGWLDSWCLGWAFFDWAGGPVWGWDGLINGERSVLRIVPQARTAVVLMTNASTGRAMYRSLFAELMEPLCGITFAPLHLEPSSGAAGNLSRYAGVYAWPDRRVEVTPADDCLTIRSEDGEVQAFALDERTFVVDAADPDNPTVTFADFDDSGRPGVLYVMLWGLPRVDG